MATYFFTSDLHGHSHRYHELFAAIADEKPAAVFLGGDLLPSGFADARVPDGAHHDFVNGFLVKHLRKLRQSLGEAYPRVFVILGNDDYRAEEPDILAATTHGIWEYMHERHASLDEYDVYGYACVPPSPFLLKDWERYDVSRHVDLGCVSPEKGHRSVLVPANEIRYATIQEDLRLFVGDADLAQTVMLFHAPPYKTNLDRAALDGKMVDHAPLDVHVGSIAIQRFIEERQPLITLHGHIHESARLTGSWSQRIGRTYCFSAAHDGPELALVRFDPANPASAARTLI